MNKIKSLLVIEKLVKMICGRTRRRNDKTTNMFMNTLYSVKKLILSKIIFFKNECFNVSRNFCKYQELSFFLLGIHHVLKLYCIIYDIIIHILNKITKREQNNGLYKMCVKHNFLLMNKHMEIHAEEKSFA